MGDEVLSMAACSTKIFTGISGTNVISGYNWDGESEGVVGPSMSADVTAMASSRQVFFNCTTLKECLKLLYACA